MRQDTVSVWAETLLGLGEPCWLLNLTHKSDVDERNLIATKSNFKSATISHDANDDYSLAVKLAVMRSDFDFLIEEELSLCDVCFVFHILNLLCV